MSQADAADAVSLLLEQWTNLPVDIPWTWVQDVESVPPRPLAACTLRLAALFKIYGLTWVDLLKALGVWDDEDSVSEVFKDPAV